MVGQDAEVSDMLLYFKDQKLQENIVFLSTPFSASHAFFLMCYFGKRMYLAFERFSLCGV